MTRPALLTWVTFGVALLALIETANALWAPRRTATAEDWRAAAAEVRAGFRSGDLIVFAPDWADQAGRAQLGDLMPLDLVGRSDDARYPRIWELSLRGDRAPETRKLEAKTRTEHGRVTVARYEKPAVELVWDSTARFADARLTGRAEVRTLEVDYRPRHGILAPLEQGRKTSLEWNDVPLGATLVGWAGLHDYYARKNAGGPIDLQLFVDGQLVTAQRVVNADGWKRFEAATAPGRHSVRVLLTAPNAAWRNAGFHLEARK